MNISKLMLIGLLLTTWVPTQDPNKPVLSGFERLRRSCDEADSIIDSERKRLGAAFEKELVKYLGDDVDKHYEIACHISDCCRKTEDTSLDLLSLMISQQALALLQNKKDEHSLYTTVSFRVIAAVQSEKLGLHYLAIEHKSEAQRLVSTRPILKGGFPAMSKEEWQLYDALPSHPPVKRSAGRQ